jgi:glycosyltransferase involved in cell wall biosynthesis
MKVLFLSPYMPHPPQSGGPRRFHGVVSELGRRHDVSVLAFTAPGEEMEELQGAMSGYCTRVVGVENDRVDRALALDLKRKRATQLHSLLRPRSYERLIYHRPEFQRALDDLVAGTRFDVITMESPLVAGYALPRTARLVLDEHNIEYDILRRTTSTERASLRKLYNWANYLKLRREERAAWQQVDGITLTSERDAQMVRRDAPHKPTAVIPNGVDTEFFRHSGRPVEPGTVLFFGAINYYPNTDGLLFFLDEVFPLVKGQVPGSPEGTEAAGSPALRVKLWIVGQQPPPAIAERAAEDVIVTGLVDDVRPYLERAAVVVVPLRIGGGTRLKIVEAMAMGKAIVATRLGAEGLDVRDGVDILLADTPHEFAAQVARVLRDPELARRLGEAARRHAEERYTWRAAVDRLERFYQELPQPAAPVVPTYGQKVNAAGGS